MPGTGDEMGGGASSGRAGRVHDEAASRVVLVVRPGCHLCDDARDVVRTVAGDVGTTWREVSIEGDAELTARYGDLVPVVLVDGTQHTFHRVDPGRLADTLRGPADAGPAWLRRWRRRQGV